MNTVIELTVARLKPAIKHLGLSVLLLDPPYRPECLKEWEVRDVDGLVYASIRVLTDGHYITFASDYSLRGVGEISRFSTRDKVDKAIEEAYNLSFKPPSKLVELENDYLALEIEEELLQNKVKEATKQIELDKKRLNTIGGLWRGDWGLKRSKQEDIKKEKIRLENDLLARPVFRDRPQDEEDYRVSRVTHKCVFLRRAGGSTQEDRIMKDGSNWHLYGFTVKGFDLEATIKRFEEAKNNG